MPVTKSEAIRRLRDAGLHQKADELRDWRSRSGNNWGWDGWVRKQPSLVPVIW
jgi:hypothetical protein